MALQLIDGDYEKDAAGRLKTVAYTEELLQNVRTLLTAHRRRFYPNKSFGRRIIDGTPPVCQYALEAARQALDGLDGVFVKDARMSDGDICLTLQILDEEREVTVTLE